jgi:hypothetical protein
VKRCMAGDALRGLLQGKESGRSTGVDVIGICCWVVAVGDLAV